MVTDRIVILFSSLIRGASPRRALLTTVGGSLGLLGSAHPVAARKKKKKHCPPCKKRKNGKCKKKRPDGTACSGGTCQGGRCVATGVPPGPEALVFETPGTQTFTAPQAGTVTIEAFGAGGGAGGDGGAGGATTGAGGGARERAAR